MSTYTIIITPEIVLALREFIPQKDDRPYLHGLRVELNQSESFLVATDGRVLWAYHHDEGHGEADTGQVRFTVPKALLVGLKAEGSIAISLDEDQKTCTLQQQGVIRSTNIIPDHYPDWRRTIPTSISGKAALYDPALMVPIAKAAKHLGAEHSYVTPNGESGGHVGFGREDIVGVIMPLRGEMVRSFPEWCRA